jgi:hypothetical protein
VNLAGSNMRIAPTVDHSVLGLYVYHASCTTRAAPGYTNVIPSCVQIVDDQVSGGELTSGTTRQ